MAKGVHTVIVPLFQQYAATTPILGHRLDEQMHLIIDFPWTRLSDQFSSVREVRSQEFIKNSGFMSDKRDVAPVKNIKDTANTL